ncbi:MAG: ATP-binding cassette domain-containing protein [Myxococcota bacterium]
MPSKPAIEFDHVTKAFGAHVAIRAIDLSIPSSRTTVLIGPSGCGKSTLLRMVAGLIEPDEGRVRIDGRSLAPAILPAVRDRLGYVIQEGGLFPHLTARENVSLVARLRGWSDTAMRVRLTELLDLAQLPTTALDRYPLELSGGQRQRVSLMRALMRDPEILLLDEPLGALDPMIRSELQHELRRIFRQLHKTVLLVTHDLAEAGYFGEDIVLMREGQIAQRGTLESLVDDPADGFVRAFVNAQRQPGTASEAAP